MHELAVTEAVVDAILERTGDAAVSRVLLEIGKLSGVVPDAVRFCFDLCGEGTVVEGASLDIIETPGRARCRVRMQPRSARRVRCGSRTRRSTGTGRCPR